MKKNFIFICLFFISNSLLSQIIEADNPNNCPATINPAFVGCRNDIGASNNCMTFGSKYIHNQFTGYGYIPISDESQVFVGLGATWDREHINPQTTYDGKNDVYDLQLMFGFNLKRISVRMGGSLSILKYSQLKNYIFESDLTAANGVPVVPSNSDYTSKSSNNMNIGLLIFTENLFFGISEKYLKPINNNVLGNDNYNFYISPYYSLQLGGKFMPFASRYSTFDKAAESAAAYPIYVDAFYEYSFVNKTGLLNIGTKLGLVNKKDEYGAIFRLSTNSSFSSLDNLVQPIVGFEYKHTLTPDKSAAKCKIDIGKSSNVFTGGILFNLAPALSSSLYPYQLVSVYFRVGWGVRPSRFACPIN